MTYGFRLQVPRDLVLGDHSFPRESFFQWVGTFSGFLGLHEGSTSLLEDVWDEAQAPLDRDCVNDQPYLQSSLYFASYDEAFQARTALIPWFDQVPEVELQKNEDWDAQWRASFLNAGEGIFVEPCWRVVPYWKEPEVTSLSWIRINPGAGFGTGTHETTQLCLQAIGRYLEVDSGKKALDFGSGSGILAIAMAIRGMPVDAVEIDPLAQENALENAKHNEVVEKITFSTFLPQGSYDLVVANILKNVLISFADTLVQRLNSGGILILSGLMDQDFLSVFEEYRKKRSWVSVEVLHLGVWRALVLRSE
jgi:ribosomal protein L11 methyltransferase